MSSCWVRCRARPSPDSCRPAPLLGHQDPLLRLLQASSVPLLPPALEHAISKSRVCASERAELAFHHPPPLPWLQQVRVPCSPRDGSAPAPTSPWAPGGFCSSSVISQPVWDLLESRLSTGLLIPPGPTPQPKAPYNKQMSPACSKPPVSTTVHNSPKVRTAHTSINRQMSDGQSRVGPKSTGPNVSATTNREAQIHSPHKHYAT